MIPETHEKKSILVIDDEDSICLAFEQFFRRRGWAVQTAATAGDGLGAYESTQPDVVFLDVRLPDRSGLELLEDLANRNAQVVVITAYGGLETVVQALKGKAYDYLAKPLDLDAALSLADRVLAEQANPASPSNAPTVEWGLLVGASPTMQETYKQIARASRSDSPVLIHGATGTGKELAALAIHHFSARSNGSFVAVNCSALPEHLIESELFGHVRGAFTGAHADRAGKFETAHDGCLLLDEIGDLPLAVQGKLLRVLDGGKIERVGSSATIQTNVRIIAATNKNLAGEVKAGRFRQDLYYRLAVLRIDMPPLSDRKEDIPLLAEHFLHRFRSPSDSQSHVLGSDALDAMMRYDWPGNVRELKNAVEHAMTVAPDRTIQAGDLPESIRPSHPFTPSKERLREAAIRYAAELDETEQGRYQKTLEEVEHALIRHALSLHESNQSLAARYLGLHRNTLRNKIKDIRST
ncbi:MAG: sigma-54-dependent Fis family transcriptional regulator [Phycisphaerae bacterium]|nr:sigma-54-dependent Fis family transcriptional regulator [Phycisphaerae bacterium]